MADPFNPLEIKPEHNNYREVQIHLILLDDAAYSLMQLINGENPWRPFLYGKATGSGVLSYLDALQRANHYKRMPS